MALAKRIGIILKEAREERKLTIQDVSRETNMIPRYVDALEKEDYTIFPSETYAIGFLRSYAEFLNLDPESVSSLYRGVQIDQAQAPVRELTRPIGNSSLFKIIESDTFQKGLYGFLGLMVFIGFIYIIYRFWPEGKGDLPDPALVCDVREKTAMNLPGPGLLPVLETFTPENTGLLIVDTMGIQVCAKTIDPLHKKAIMIFVFEGKRGVEKELKEGEVLDLSSVLPGLEEAKMQVKMKPRKIAAQALSMEMETTKGAGSESPSQANAVEASSELIRVSLQFVGDSYLEWVDDGRSHSGVFIHSGETRTFEAKNRLELKVGNGGGVRIIREGSAPRLAGPAGSIVKMSYKMAPDPLDPGMTRVVESLEVVR